MLKIESLSKGSFHNKFEQHKKIDVVWDDTVFASDINKINDLPACDENLIEESQRFYVDEFHSKTIQTHSTPRTNEDNKKEKSYAIIAEENESLVEDLRDVLDAVAFPNNRPTRLLQDYRGSSFSIRGYIKFICSNGQYKKIYENMIGNPRKDYRVSLILDVSQSMAGMAEVGSTQVILALAGKFLIILII